MTRIQLTIKVNTLVRDQLVLIQHLRSNHIDLKIIGNFDITRITLQKRISQKMGSILMICGAFIRM